MPAQLTRFRVIGLHGSRTIDVQLRDNRLILVGENGTGKSTFVNLIYYFLTRQWGRLAEYGFSRIQASFGERDFVITPNHIEEHQSVRHGFLRLSRHRLAPHAFDQLMDALAHDVTGTEEAIVERLARESHMPPRLARQLVADLFKETKGKPSHIQTLERQLSEIVRSQFLYLPTYRRIEHDLRSIFRGVDIEADLRKFRERIARRPGATYIELVEFGMEDVEQTINARMTHIKEAVRDGLDNLTGTYLRDVIRGVHTQVDVQSLSGLDSKALDAIFDRIDERTLPAFDKEHLRAKVQTISAAQTIGEQDKVIAHFLSKLTQFYAEQQANERNVREFVSICNQYLAGKQLVYDNIKYRIYIRQDGSGGADGEDALQMRSLSSGEKQIVSLFSHLYLSGEARFFVIIDEPELSLSVPWQRRFLPDIVATGMCDGLIAVTHSPFVWDNELEPHVRSLAEFTVPYSEATGRPH